MMFDDDNAAFEADVDRLFCKLIANLPHDLRCLIATAIGIAASSDLCETDTSSLSTPLKRAEVDVDQHFNAPDPLRWAPRVVALCCIAYNQPLRMAVPVAATLQLLGIASSVLDAVQDNHQDLIRAYGHLLPANHPYNVAPQVGMALLSNAGVTIINLAWQALLQYGPEYGVAPTTSVEIGQLISKHMLTACCAQHLDLTAGRTCQPTLDQYHALIAGKADAVGGTVGEAAAILAGTGADRQLWYTLGAKRTAVQQLHDDYLDLQADLGNGQQISQAVLYGLAIAGPEDNDALRAMIAEARSQGTAATTTSHALIRKLQELGAFDYAMTYILMQCRQALHALDALRLPDYVHQALQRWVLAGLPAALQEHCLGA